MTANRDDLKMVARHGNSKLTRALAVVELAEREGRLDELRETVSGGS